METATLFVQAAQIWGYAGLAVAAVFLTVGMDRIEPNSRTSFVFRPLLIPGTVILWPLVLWRWFVLESGRDNPNARHDPPRRFHKAFWVVFAFVIPAILITGMIVRQDGPRERPAIRLEAPQ